MDMQNLTLFAGIGAIAGFWGQIKGFLNKTFSLLLRQDSIENYTIAKMFAQELIKDCKIIRFGNKTFGGGHGFLKHKGFYDTFIFLEGRSYIALYKKVPIIISESQNGVKVRYLWGTFDFKGLLEKTYNIFLNEREGESSDNKYSEFYVMQYSGKTKVSDYNTAEESRIKNQLSSIPGPSGQSEKYSCLFQDVHVLKDKNELIGIKYDDIGESKDTIKPDYYWSKEGLEFFNEVKFWIHSEKWFNDRNLPWTRSVLLKSSPGKGKSKLVLETARKLGIPLFLFSLSSMSDEELISYYENLPAKCIVVFDDIDTVFHGRTNILAEHSVVKPLVSFEVFLNLLSGVKKRSSIFTVATANHPELLDEALTRSGRMDVHIELKDLDEEGKIFIANNILRDWPDLAAKTAKEFQGTAADFENKCTTIALKKYYEQRTN